LTSGHVDQFRKLEKINRIKEKEEKGTSGAHLKKKKDKRRR